jgi:hypothetical protein
MPLEDLPPSLEIAPLLEALTRNGVDFVIIGGMAGVAHGSAMPTFDLDIAYARDKANLSRLVKALREIQVTLRGAPDDLPFQLDALTLENGSNFTFDSRHGRFDVLGYVDGIRDYSELRNASQIVEISGSDVRIASIDHLIAMKRAANRPKDRNMIEEYLVLADLEEAERDGL